MVQGQCRSVYLNATVPLSIWINVNDHHWTWTITKIKNRKTNKHKVHWEKVVFSADDSQPFIYCCVARFVCCFGFWWIIFELQSVYYVMWARLAAWFAVYPAIHGFLVRFCPLGRLIIILYDELEGIKIDRKASARKPSRVPRPKRWKEIARRRPNDLK